MSRSPKQFVTLASGTSQCIAAHNGVLNCGPGKGEMRRISAYDEEGPPSPTALLSPKPNHQLRPPSCPLDWICKASYRRPRFRGGRSHPRRDGDCQRFPSPLVPDSQRCWGPGGSSLPAPSRPTPFTETQASYSTVFRRCPTGGSHKPRRLSRCRYFRRQQAEATTATASTKAPKSAAVRRVDAAATSSQENANPEGGLVMSGNAVLGRTQARFVRTSSRGLLACGDVRQPRPGALVLLCPVKSTSVTVTRRETWAGIAERSARATTPTRLLRTDTSEGRRSMSAGRGGIPARNGCPALGARRALLGSRSLRR